MRGDQTPADLGLEAGGQLDLAAALTRSPPPGGLPQYLLQQMLEFLPLDGVHESKGTSFCWQKPGRSAITRGRWKSVSFYHPVPHKFGSKMCKYSPRLHSGALDGGAVRFARGWLRQVSSGAGALTLDPRLADGPPGGTRAQSPLCATCCLRVMRHPDLPRGRNSGSKLVGELVAGSFFAPKFQV